MSGPTPNDVAGAVDEALRRAFNLGQTYWQQADSDSFAQNRKSDDTRAKFQQVRQRAVDVVRAALAAQQAAPAPAVPAVSAWECKTGGLRPLTQQQYEKQSAAIRRHYTRIAAHPAPAEESRA